LRLITGIAKSSGDNEHFDSMRAEIQNIVAEIKQSAGLLRRHL